MLFSNEAKGTILAQYRKQHGMTQSYVCNETSVTNSHLSLVESGKRGFGKKNLLKILDLYRVSPDTYIKDVIQEEARISCQLREKI